jgi:hypothetical protein
MNKPITYTVFRPWDSSIVLGRGLTAVEAARAIVGCDDRVYSLRKEGEFWYLYTSPLSRDDGRLLRAGYYSLAKDEAEAWEDIARQVIAHHWEGGPIALPDREYLEYRRAMEVVEAAAADADD